MDPVAILYPALAMFCLTMACIFTLGISRYRAIQQREVKISYYRSYDQGAQPPRLHILGRHVQHHFEVPPLFYIGVVLAFVSAATSMATLAFAWLFVAARLAHSWIHLGSNNVSRRFFVFGFSLIMLCGLWFSTFYGIVQAAG